jgi:hypothetical protein
MIKKCLLFTLAVLLVMGTVAFAHEDTQKHQSCPLCGMDREKFAHSRILIEYEDGTAFGACSLRCAAVELAIQTDKMPKMIGVGDYNTKNLIDAEKAYWVVGGSKSGVMTKRAKWAFEKKTDAGKFIAENGGSLITFDQAIKSAYEDMYLDTKMIREKRKMMKMRHPH